MEINGGYDIPITGRFAQAPLTEGMSITAHNLRLYQRDQLDTTIAFRKAVLKVAGYGNKIDAIY
jgi:hypothetical protein